MKPPPTTSRRPALLHSIIGPGVDPARIDTYIDRGPEALQFLVDHSPLKREWVKNYSDYYPEAPGGLSTGARASPNRSTAGAG